MLPIKTKTTDYTKLVEKTNLVLNNGPDAHDLKLVDDYFHELRAVSTDLITAYAQVKTDLAKAHFNYLTGLDRNSPIYLITKSSSTLITNICNANCGDLYELQTKLESLLDLINSTFIQYNTLLSANKKYG